LFVGSSASSDKVNELEESIAAKHKELADAKSSFDEQLSELMNRQSALQLENGEFDNRLKQITDSHAAELKKNDEKIQSKVTELQKQHEEALTKTREEHDAASNKLLAEMGAHAENTQAKIQTEMEAKSQKHSKEIQELKVKMADHVDKMKSQFVSNINAEKEKHKTETETAENKDKKREEQVAKLEARRYLGSTIEDANDLGMNQLRNQELDAGGQR